ncbi:MAG: hypothetical protein ACR2PT_10385 [Endozoicomonas sp.]
MYAPPWGLYPVTGQSDAGLILDMYKTALGKMGIDHQFSYAPHLRLHQQLDAGEIDMVAISDGGLKHIQAEVFCGTAITRSQVKLYTRPGTELGEDGFPELKARIAIPPGSERLFGSFLSERPGYHYVNPRLMKKLFVSGRIDHMVDFSDRIELRLVADKIPFDSRVLGATNFYLCIRDDYPDARRVVDTVTDTVLTFLEMGEEEGLFWHYGKYILQGSE